MLEKEETKSTEAIVELMQLLQTFDSDSIEAKLNETTMSDNNGGRINY
jgi:hypothetical protein